MDDGKPLQGPEAEVVLARALDESVALDLKALYVGQSVYSLVKLRGFACPEGVDDTRQGGQGEQWTTGAGTDSSASSMRGLGILGLRIRRVIKDGRNERANGLFVMSDSYPCRGTAVRIIAEMMGN